MFTPSVRFLVFAVVSAARVAGLWAVFRRLCEVNISEQLEFN